MDYLDIHHWASISSQLDLATTAIVEYEIKVGLHEQAIDTKEDIRILDLVDAISQVLDIIGEYVILNRGIDG